MDDVSDYQKAAFHLWWLYYNERREIISADDVIDIELHCGDPQITFLQNLVRWAQNDVVWLERERQRFLDLQYPHSKSYRAPLL